MKTGAGAASWCGGDWSASARMLPAMVHCEKQQAATVDMYLNVSLLFGFIPVGYRCRCNLTCKLIKHLQFCIVHLLPNIYAKPVMHNCTSTVMTTVMMTRNPIP